MVLLMIRVSPTRAGAPASGARRASKASGEFRVDGGPKPAGAPAAASAAAPVETLSALIALQSDGERAGRRAKTIVAAQRALDLLDCLRRDLLEGVVSIEDLDSLAEFASLRSASPEVDGTLLALYEEIALRARVELAKRGRL